MCAAAAHSKETGKTDNRKYKNNLQRIKVNRFVNTFKHVFNHNSDCLLLFGGSRSVSAATPVLNHFKPVKVEYYHSVLLLNSNKFKSI